MATVFQETQKERRAKINARTLTERDIENLLEISGADDASEILPEILFECKVEQRKHHQTSTGSIPEAGLKAALKRCGFEKMGRLVRRTPVPTADDDDEMSANDAYDLTAPEHKTIPAGNQDEQVAAVKSKAATTAKSDNPCAGIEPGTSVCVFHEDSLKSGTFEGLGAGGRAKVKFFGKDQKTILFKPGDVEVQELPPDNSEGE